ncbi:MAG: transposase family protein [Bacteroidales bacterium]|nr:transposase family protein [Bacteroidales bacterium]
MSKVKRLQKQAERQARHEEKIRTAEAEYVRYETRIKRKAQPNRLSQHESVAEEYEERQQATEESLKVYRRLLPTLLQRMSHIPDLRKPGKVKHQKTVLMVYGILMFVFQMSSRRDANKTMSQPIFLENMRAMFPEWETLPHADTLNRFLERTDVNAIQESLIDLFKSLIRKKKLRQELANGRYVLAIDGTQKFTRDRCWQSEYMERHIGANKQSQYYVYILEAVLTLENGMALPLMSEFLKNEDYRDENTKQDCETKAFHRLAKKLKQYFPKLKICVVLDGLYANGPIIRTCRQHKWDFMIVLKQECLKSVWSEFNVLQDKEDSLVCRWGERKQVYHWVNQIEYDYDKRKREMVHVVTCQETWQTTEAGTEQKQEQILQYAWLSNVPLTKKNVFSRCTRMGRYRWKIENNFLMEKHHGYRYEHCYARNWNAMLGYHYLMNIARFFHVLAFKTNYLARKVAQTGYDKTLRFLALACTGSVMNTDRIRSIVSHADRCYLSFVA